MTKKPVYAAVVEANRRAQREVAVSLGIKLKSEQDKPASNTEAVPTKSK